MENEETQTHFTKFHFFQSTCCSMVLYGVFSRETHRTDDIDSIHFLRIICIISYSYIYKSKKKFQIKWRFHPQKMYQKLKVFGGFGINPLVFLFQTSPKFHPSPQRENLQGGGLEFGHCRAAGPNHETRPTKNRRNGGATVGVPLGSKVPGGKCRGPRSKKCTNVLGNEGNLPTMTPR